MTKLTATTKTSCPLFVVVVALLYKIITHDTSGIAEAITMVFSAWGAIYHASQARMVAESLTKAVVNDA